MSRLLSRSAIEWRLSCLLFPLPSPISTFAYPFLKYIFSGTRVIPFCCTCRQSFAISRLCASSFRVRPIAC